ncbi:hypothetical protein N7499_008457 [Penicillium canescens]|nr:hypothetical protein N7499_008457 [Penicillium canescens]KAJ6158784.1 hypothetical protein N7485_011610 [Penicillium canescens]
MILRQMILVRAFIDAMKLIHLSSFLTRLFISRVVALPESGNDTVLSKSLHERDAALKATPDGICQTYTLQAGETCAALATRYGITAANIETWNTGAWGWTGCNTVKQGDFICLSPGNHPMPVALPNAICGPQVPGTARPARLSDLASLNPCASSQCVSANISLSRTSIDYIISKCGTMTEFCGIGCLSNCKQADSLAKKRTSSETTTKPTSTASKTSTKTTSTTTKATSNTTTIIAESSSITKKKAAKTTSEAPIPRWQITIYKDKGCESEEYLSVQGHHTRANTRCINLSDNLKTDINDYETSCRKWTDGGLNWGSCKGQTISKPKSYFITAGQCTIYGDQNCVTESYQGDVRNPAAGCQYPQEFAWSPEDFVSMRCWDPTIPSTGGDTDGWYPDAVTH